MQRHAFALQCLFRSERPLTDSKDKAVRERVRQSFSRLRLIAAGSDDLQNAGEPLLLTRNSPRPRALAAAAADGCNTAAQRLQFICDFLMLFSFARRLLLSSSQRRTAGARQQKRCAVLG
jgi:hypothetical protein